MDAGQYYITTITNAALKLGPMIFYVVAGYFLFIKLPFLIFYRNIQKPKASSNDFEFKADPDFQKKMEEERKKEFQERMKNLGGEKNQNQEKAKKEETKEQKRSEESSSKKKEEPKASQGIKASPEEILFKLKAGQIFTAQELKKTYHKLLQEHHPDKFRTEHQKEFAEMKTKNINEAYQKLKKRVS